VGASVANIDGVKAEIEAGVEAAVGEMKGEAKAADPEPKAEADEPEAADPEPEADAEPEADDADADDEPEADDPEPEADDEADDEPEADEPPPGPSDEVIERAIRAGIPLSEIKQYPNEALLTAMCARIEGAEGGAGSRSDAGGDGQPAGVDDLLSAIPDLDEETYDETIVAFAKSMKEIIKQQQETIENLRGGQAEDWLDAKLEGVKDFTKGDADKRSAVREKFGVLKAGYKAAGKDATDGVVFDEAVKLVLGGEMEAARLKQKGRAASKRSGQRIQRPTGRRAQERPDAGSEIAEMLERKFGL